MSHDQSEMIESRGGRAQAELEMALKSLSDVSGRQLQIWVKTLERDVVSSVHSISRAAVDGIKELKRELSVSAAISRHPAPWVVGAAVVGAASAVFFVTRQDGHATSGQGAREENLDHLVPRRFAQSDRPGRWLFLAAELAIALLNAKQQQASRVVREPRD